MPARAADTVSNETLPEVERRRFIDKLRKDTEHEYSERARQAVRTQLSAGHPYPWAYVYELVQNAIDAKARRCLWRSTADGVEFHHDGSLLLDKSHVRGIASLGDSTKGLDTVGFMGIGFKSVFARYRRIRITGNGWRFGFEIGFRRGEVGQNVPMWFDALLPHWDDAAGNPADNYTTAIRLDRRWQAGSSPLADIERLAPEGNPERLAVLGLRGLEQLRIDDVTWDMRNRDGIVELRRSGDDTLWQWKAFTATYCPDDDAMRRFLEARHELQDQRDRDGRRVKRSAVALLPLDNDGMPYPPKRGTTYATLPTDTGLPFGFHLQADWLVNADRGVLREVTGNSWQEAIVRQLPDIVLTILSWYANMPVYAIPRSYDVLCNPTTGDGPLAQGISALHSEFRRRLSRSEIAPIHGAGEKRFISPERVARIPAGFQRNFRNRPEWRPDLLFGRPVLDEGALGERGAAFARWLAWGREIDVNEVRWLQTLPKWWSALPSDDRVDALFALWKALAVHESHDAPVVPTESGKWIAVRDAVWLTEEPPSINEPYGEIIAAALREHLPHEDQRLPPNIRHAVNSNRHIADGPKWFLTYAKQRKLPDAVQRACSGIRHNVDFPFVELARWAVHRGEQRQDFVPVVATEQGPRHPSKALIADPLIEGGKSRRRLFADTPAIIEEYAEDDASATLRLLELAGARGGGDLVEVRSAVSRYRTDEVARRLDVPTGHVEWANNNGYEIIDYRFPFDNDTVSCDVLQDWLSREYMKFASKGRLYAHSSYYGHRRTPGRAPASWVVTLQDNPWVLCKDGNRRKPADVVLPPGVDFDDAPIADIDSGLAQALETEGVRFGSKVSKSSVLRRLSNRGSRGIPGHDLAELLREARTEMKSGRITREDIRAALDSVVLQHETGMFPLRRIVQRAGGAAARGTLGGWVIRLSDLDGDLVSAMEPVWDVPDAITGRQALDYLLDVWDRRPNQVDGIRGPIATAFRYVFDDIDCGKLPREDWDDVRERARLFGRDTWHELGPELIVEDTRSPLVRKFLSPDRVAVSASHLGETQIQIRRTANNLGLGLLSDEVKIVPGPQCDAPDNLAEFRILIDMLASLKDRRSLREVVVVDHLWLRVADNEHRVNAHVEGERLYLSGSIRDSAIEAAAQLVEYFRLGQQGEIIPYLTGALSAIDDDQGFRRNLEILAEGLGVSIPDGVIEKVAPAGGGTVTGSASNSPSDEGQTADGTARGDGEPMTATGRPAGNGGASGGVPYSDEKRPNRTAADRFGAIKVAVEPRLQEPDAVEGRQKSEESYDDSGARRAVLDYEMKEGRIAHEMTPENPGYDIESRERGSDVVRRIEVKGVRGIYREDASVILSDRQGRDALRNENEKVQYWLYVVDRMETDAPTVHPVSWTRSRLQFGFYASVWANANK